MCCSLQPPNPTASPHFGIAEDLGGRPAQVLEAEYRLVLGPPQPRRRGRGRDASHGKFAWNSHARDAAGPRNLDGRRAGEPAPSPSCAASDRGPTAMSVRRADMSCTANRNNSASIRTNEIQKQPRSFRKQKLLNEQRPARGKRSRDSLLLQLPIEWIIQ